MLEILRYCIENAGGEGYPNNDKLSNQRVMMLALYSLEILKAIYTYFNTPSEDNAVPINSFSVINCMMAPTPVSI